MKVKRRKYEFMFVWLILYDWVYEHFDSRTLIKVSFYFICFFFASITHYIPKIFKLKNPPLNQPNYS